METIKNNEVLKEILKDSFGGVLYNVANRNKYNTEELLKAWDKLTPSEQEAHNGLINGAINFIKGN